MTPTNKPPLNGEGTEQSKDKKRQSLQKNRDGWKGVGLSLPWKRRLVLNIARNWHMSFQTGSELPRACNLEGSLRVIWLHSISRLHADFRTWPLQKTSLHGLHSTQNYLSPYPYILNTFPGRWNNCLLSEWMNLMLNVTSMCKTLCVTPGT